MREKFVIEVKKISGRWCMLVFSIDRMRCSGFTLEIPGDHDSHEMYILDEIRNSSFLEED